MKESKTRTLIAVVLGVLIGLFGLFCLFFPNQAARTLTVVFGLAILVTAILSVIDAFNLRKLTRYWSIVFVEALVDIVLGLILVFVPDAIQFIVKVMGAWAITFGIFRLVRGVLRDGSELGLLITGLCASALGVLMFIFPETVQQAATYVIGSLLVIGSVIVAWAGIARLKAVGPETAPLADAPVAEEGPQPDDSE